MLPVVQIGPLALPAPQLILLAGFWIGLELTEKQAERFHAASGPIYNMTLVAVLAGLVGARLAYAAQYPSAFLAAPLNLLTPRPQMLDTTGGLIIGLLAALLYGWIKKLPLWPTLDAATTLFSVMGLRWGWHISLRAMHSARRRMCPGQLNCGANCATPRRCTKPWRRC